MKKLLIIVIVLLLFSLTGNAQLDPYLSVKQTVTMTATGEQQTTVIDKSGYKYMSIFMPSSWTTADITLLGCLTKDGTFVPITKGSDGAELTLTVDASTVVTFDTDALQNLIAAVPFVKLRSGTAGSDVVEDCEDVWNELEDGDVTQTLETTDVQVGSGALKWVIAEEMVAGDIIATETISVDLATDSYEGIRLWIKSSVDTADGNLKLLLDEDANCASPSETLEIPALTADEWTQVNMSFDSVGDADLDTLISVGIEYDADLGECTIYVDDVNAVLEVAQAAERSFDIALYR